MVCVIAWAGTARILMRSSVCTAFPRTRPRAFWRRGTAFARFAIGSFGPPSSPYRWESARSLWPWAPHRPSRTEQRLGYSSLRSRCSGASWHTPGRGCGVLVSAVKPGGLHRPTASVSCAGHRIRPPPSPTAAPSAPSAGPRGSLPNQKLNKAIDSRFLFGMLQA